MSEKYFVWFRCWPGFSESFPFKQFNGLSDEELGPAMESFAREYLRSPDGRKQIKAVREWRREAKASIRGQFVARPGTHSQPKERKAVSLPPYPLRDSSPAAINRPLWLGAYIKLFSRASYQKPGPQVWFLNTPSRKFAELLVAELDERRTLDYDAHLVDYKLNPRYGFVDAASFSEKQQTKIQRCINAIQEGREPAVLDRKRMLHVGRAAFEVAEELARAWPAESETLSPGASKDGGDAANMTPRKRKRKQSPQEVIEKRDAKRKRRKSDKLLYEAWANGRGQYRTKAQLAKEKGMEADDLVKALERHRSRLRRTKKGSAKKAPQ